MSDKKYLINFTQNGEKYYVRDLEAHEAIDKINNYKIDLVLDENTYELQAIIKDSDGNIVSDQGVKVDFPSEYAIQLCRYNSSTKELEFETNLPAHNFSVSVAGLISDIENSIASLTSNKVDKTIEINGKQLSANITLTKSDIELGNVDNTSDADKPISTAAQQALDNKVNKTTTIASIDLQNNITKDDLKSALEINLVQNTGDSDTPTENGTTKFTTGGAFSLKTELESSINNLGTSKVSKTTTIAGVDLEDNITKEELLTAINVEDGAQVNKIEKISVDNNELNIINKEINIDLSGKADKVSSAVSGNFAALDSNGNLIDSGKKTNDFATADQGTKADNAVRSISASVASTSGTIKLSVNTGGVVSDIDAAVAGLKGGAFVDIDSQINENSSNPVQNSVIVDFVNSSIATNTATFRGTFDISNDLGLDLETDVNSSSINPKIKDELINNGITAYKNDYVFISYPNAAGTTIVKYVRFKFNGSNWVYEYTLNNSSFTAAQWTAINSGITAGKIESIDELISNLGINKVDKTTTINNHPLSSNITITKGDIDLGNVVNTGDSNTPTENGTTKFTTGGAYTELNKKVDKATIIAGIALSGNITEQQLSNALFTITEIEI